MSDDLYSLVQRRIWTDARFRKLSKPEPNARDLFLYLLTTPRATPIPGLIVAGEPALAEELDWSLKGLQRCMAELEAAGMVRLDRAARLLWLPNGLRHNPPRSPKNVVGWAKHWRLLPECDLLTEATVAFATNMSERGASFSSAFCRVLGINPPPERSDDGEHDRSESRSEMGSMTGSKTASPMPSQEQEQDQDTKTHTSRARAPARVQDEAENLMPLPAFTHEALAALLVEIPALAPVAEDPTEVGELYQGFRIACGDAATEELARTAIGTLLAKERLGDMTARQRRERVGTYLANARKYSRSTDRDSEPRSLSSDVRVVLAVFDEVWTAKKRKPFVQAQGDEKHAAFIVDRAWEEAGKLKMRPRDLVRFWAEKHLACADRWVVDSDHALRTMGSQLTSYGLPVAKKTTPPRPPAPAPEGPVGPPTGEVLEAMKRHAAELAGRAAGRPS